jgi:hypothetical protein
MAGAGCIILYSYCWLGRVYTTLLLLIAPMGVEGYMDVRAFWCNWCLSISPNDHGPGTIVQCGQVSNYCVSQITKQFSAQKNAMKQNIFGCSMSRQGIDQTYSRKYAGTQYQYVWMVLALILFNISCLMFKRQFVIAKCPFIP